VPLREIPETQRCSHPYIIGDTFIHNCKTCGLYFPLVSILSLTVIKPERGALRAPGREFECNFFISDLLREAYTLSLKRP
jgi:hypothetical protein